MNKCLYCYQEVESGDFHKKCSLLFFGTETPPVLEYSLSEMNALAKEVIERSIAVPGVQPKLSMSVLSEALSPQRLTVVGALGGNYIFKPPTSEYIEMPGNEHFTMRVAELFSIRTVPSTLIRLQSGELAYLTKRIDRREDDTKIHMLDMFQITEAVDKYKSSMEKVSRALTAFTSNTGYDILQLFEWTLFSFLFGNNDMHLKNFSMIKSTHGWELAPAYDLLNVSVLNPKDKEELALTMNGKKSRLKMKDFQQFSQHLGLTKKQENVVYKRFTTQLPNMKGLLAISFLSAPIRKEYLAVVLKRYQQLDLG